MNGVKYFHDIILHSKVVNLFSSSFYFIAKEIYQQKLSNSNVKCKEIEGNHLNFFLPYKTINFFHLHTTTSAESNVYYEIACQLNIN